MTTKQAYEHYKKITQKSRRTKDIRFPSFIIIAIIAVIIASQGVVEACLTVMVAALFSLAFLAGDKR